MEVVALKAIPVMCATLLQRLHSRSKHKDHKSCLTRRLTLWKEGDILSLLEEGRTLQSRLNVTQKDTKNEQRDNMKKFC